VAVPRQLPPAVGYFTGRTEELATLSRLVAGGRQDGTAVVISAIGGTAGVGKTALAVHFAHRVAEQFPDGQLYMNLRGHDTGAPVLAADALASFLGALGLHGPHIPAGCEERAAMYRSLLAGRRMLIVLDNVHRCEQVRPLLPGTGGCAVLVTSRDNLAGLVARDGAVRLELDVLSLEASVAALRDLIGARADEDRRATALLAARCCRLPLALRVAAELAIGRPAVPLAVLAEELADLQHRLDVLDAGGDEATAVRAVFSWSYRHLDAEVARAFRLAALHPGADFDRHAVAALLDTGVQHAGRLLNRLAQAHLVHATGAWRFGMHDLLRGYAIECAAAEDGPADQAAARARLLDHYLHTAASAMETLFPTAAVHRPDLGTAPCVLAPVDDPETARPWLDAERANLIATAFFAANDGASLAHATRLSATVGQYFVFGHHLSEAVTLHGYALRAAQRRGDRAAEATALSHLGFLEWQRGRSRGAADYQQRALALFDAAIDRVGLCRALHRLALAERHLGNLAEAAAHAERVLTLSRQAGDRLGQAHALRLLATINRAQGAFLPATDLLHQDLALLDELGERRTRSVAVKELGIIDLRFGRLAVAEQRLEQAIQLAGEAGNVSGQAEALSHLGLLHLHHGRHQRAAEYQLRALAVLRRTSDRHGEAEVLARLALAELNAGHNGQARNHLEGALTMAGTLNARLVEATVLNSLGDTFLAAGQPLQAEAYFTAALALTRQTGQRDTQARAHDGLARAHTALGDHDRAHHHRREALAVYTALGVPEGEPPTDALLSFRHARTTTSRGTGR
jgi:tetratricopeptide (TPR) repeat protein